LLYDGHSSVRQLSNNSGGIVTDQVYSYDAYGVSLGYTGTKDTNLQYTGEYYDNDLSQYYLRARYYNPSNGRFNRIDPFSGNNQDPQSLHKYLYCHANPVNAIDPSGEFLSYIGQLCTWAIRKIVRGISIAVKYAVTRQFATSVGAKMVLVGIAIANMALAVYSYSFAPTVVIFMDKHLKPTKLYNPDRQDIERQIEIFKKDKIKLAAFYIRSHATSEFMHLGNKTFLQMSGGNLVVIDSQGSFDMGGALNDLLEKTGTVILAGCHTGAGESSIAQEVSSILLGRKVLGGQRFSAQTPLSDSSFFMANIFKDGKKIGEDFGFHAP